MAENFTGPLEHGIGKVLDRKTFYKLLEFRKNANLDTSEKADKVIGAEEDNLACLDDEGNLKDCGVNADELMLFAFFVARIKD